MQITPMLSTIHLTIFFTGHCERTERWQCLYYAKAYESAYKLTFRTQSSSKNINVKNIYSHIKSEWVTVS